MPIRSVHITVVVFLALGSLLPGCLSAHPSFRSADRARPQVAIALQPITSGQSTLKAKSPTDIAFLPDSEDPVLVIAEREGRLVWHRLSDGSTGTLLEITRIGSSYIEKGLVGFAFHPDFANQPMIYTYHLRASRDGGQSVISEWQVSGDSLETLKGGNQRVLFELDQPQEGHNGGQVAFGPDGYLYTAFGDGGYQNDPDNRSQDTSNYYGSMIRIDPANPADGRAYGIPADNPFLEGRHLPEVWAYGFRNPWRFTFGPGGQLIVADVGQSALEEIVLVAAGANYGWCIREGTIAHKKCAEHATGRTGADFAGPIYEYGRSEGGALIGGYFYSGKAIPELTGKYVFGDHFSGSLWALDVPDSADGQASVTALGNFGGHWTTFGRDNEGELYIGTNEGQLRKLVPR
jgi:glucose/arabinose dehydrogenase